MKTKEVIKGYKGFDKDLKCRDFQYEEGKEYETDKKPVRCTENGFHLCENPLDTWTYYPLNSGSKYYQVEGSGDVSRAEKEDSKIAVQKIKINAAVSLLDMIKIGVDVILKKVNATTGHYAHAATTGENTIAAGIGANNKAKANLGSWIVLSEYDENYKLKCVKTAKVDGKNILPDTWYMLKNGNFVKE